MDFEFSKSRKEIEKAAREFAKGEFDKEAVIDLSRGRKYPVEVYKKAVELGFIGIHFPQSCEGGGMGAVENAIVAEQFCRQNSTMGMALLFSGLATECIFRFGDKDLWERFVTPVAEGKRFSACAFFETGMFGKLGSVQTTLSQSRDGHVVHGRKNFVLNAGVADFYVVLCREAGSGMQENDLRLAIVEKEADGIEISDAGKTLGNEMVLCGDVDFQNVAVGNGNILKNGGLKQASGYLDEVRVQLAAMALGVARGAFDRGLGYIRQREQFGKKLVRFQVVRHKIAEMAMRIEQARWVVYNTAWKFDAKKCDAGDAAIAKLTACQCAMAVTDEALQLLGGYGYMTEYEVEHFYRDAKTLELLMGSGFALKDAIADAVIGKSK